MSKILIIEDEKEIAELERDYLELENMEVSILNDGKDACKHILNNQYDLILLDLMLPNGNGYDICKEIRDKIDIPIIMVTAKGQSMEKIRGLGIGADDYIAKPFDPSELVARVKSQLRIYNRLKNGHNGNSTKVINIGNISIQTESWKVYKNDEELKMANKEFELLKYMAENPNIVFSKEKLFETIWGYDYVGDVATVTVHINRIREKIEEDPQNPKIIETIWGVGYRLTK